MAGFWRGRRVLVTGATGFVGRNLVPLLAAQGCELIAPPRSRADLTEQDQVRRLLGETKPDIVLHLAGLIGGILANKERPADFCYQNLVMGTLMLHESYKAGVRKFVTLMGGCSYPAKAENPIGESTLFQGYPQIESAPYSLAKAVDAVLAQSYRQQYGFDAIVLVPGNMYGPHDNFSLTASHVIPALIRKYLEARQSGATEVVAWGTGAPVRDFVFVEDVCRAVIQATESYSGPDLINISSGTGITIRELVEMVARLCGYQGAIRWDSTKPDGQLRKIYDVTRMREVLGFTPTTTLEQGLKKTIAWFTEHHADARL